MYLEVTSCSSFFRSNVINQSYHAAVNIKPLRDSPCVFGLEALAFLGMIMLFGSLEHQVTPFCYLELILFKEIFEIVVVARAKVQYKLEGVDICQRVLFYHNLLVSRVNVQSIDIAFCNDNVHACRLKARSNLTCWALQGDLESLAII
jgi:hypothetical protein